MASGTFDRRRERLRDYFDRTAAEAWARLTSDAPVSRIRETVRQGRDRMRAQLLDWLPEDLTGRRLLDAGCGTGALAIEAAQRGARVTAVDVAGNLVAIAAERAAAAGVADRIDFRAGDMLSPDFGRFDDAVAMDSLIHYRAHDVVDALARLSSRVEHRLLITFAPRTPALTAMHGVGKLFPRADRAPAIEPVSEARLRRLIGADHRLRAWRAGRSERISRGFYVSQALEVRQA